MVFSFPFPWRRFPVGWARLPTAAQERAAHYPDISRSDFVVALREMNSFIDVTERDLLQIYDLVIREQRHRELIAYQQGKKDRRMGARRGRRYEDHQE